MPAIGKQMHSFQFEAEMIRWATKNIPLIGKKVHAAVTEAVYLGIVQKTPVLTARARGNWIPSLGAPSEEHGEHLNAGVSLTGVPPTSTERGYGKAIKQKLEALPLGSQTAYVTNNLDYISRLENGYSPKAPPGAMVQQTIINTLDGLKVEVVLKGVR